MDLEGGVYLGEYLSNRRRREIYVYYLPPGGNALQVVHRFARDEIRHVHGTYFDPFDASVWLLTGDESSECSILRTRDHFRSLEVIGKGDESWRAVSLAFREDAIYYGTDATHRSNHIVKLDRKSLERTIVCDLPGPVYYTKTTYDLLLFGVAAESLLNSTRRSAFLWSLNRQDVPKLVARYRKDSFPLLLLPGTVQFPMGPGAGRHLFNCVGLSGVDHQIMELKRVR